MKQVLTRIDSQLTRRVNKIKKLIEALNDFVGNPEYHYTGTLYAIIRPLTPAMLTAKLCTEVSYADDERDPAGGCLNGLKENPDLTEQYLCPDCFEKNKKRVEKLLKKLDAEI